MVNFKKILGTFVEIKEDEANPNTSKPAKQVTPPSSSNAAKETRQYQEMPDPNTGAAEGARAAGQGGDHATMAEMEARLKKVLEAENKKNYPGADYYEFVLALDNMKDVPVESTKYTSAFNVLAATQGLTKDHLVKTAQQYMAVIDRELGEFNAGFDKANKEQVDDKQALIESKTLKMQELSLQISALNEEIKQLSQELVDNKNKLSSTKNSFIAVAGAQKERINAELNKIGTYIK